MSTTTDAERWVPDAHTFAARLALIRQRMKWNMKEAALACGLAQGSWREWELFDRKPRDYEDVCRQISDAAWCDLGWLMTGNGDAPTPPPGQPFREPRAAAVRRLQPVADVTEDRQQDLVHASDDRWSWYAEAIADPDGSPIMGMRIIRPYIDSEQTAKAA